MRILILGINYWPEETGIGAFTTYRAEYLASVGHEVTVATGFPYYPEWKIAAKYKGQLLSTEVRNKVRILRSYIYVSNPITSFKRILHEASFIAHSFLRVAFSKRPDVLLVVSPPLGLGISAIVLSRMWGIPYAFDVEDLQPDAAADLGMLPPWLLKLMYRVEALAYRRAALVSTLTNGMRARIVDKGVPEEKVVLFEPRADESLLTISPEEGEAFRKRYALENKFIVCHSGNIGVKQGLDVMLDAAEMSRGDNSTLFLIVGDGAAREKLERRAAELKLDNLRFLPLLDGQEFRGMLAASDICLVTQQKSVSDIVFPSKTVTYLTAGCAVIASVSAGSEVARTIKESSAGFVVEPEDAGALYRAICELRGRDLQHYRDSARTYAADRWSSIRVLGNLERNLAALAGTDPSEPLSRVAGHNPSIVSSKVPPVLE